MDVPQIAITTELDDHSELNLTINETLTDIEEISEENRIEHRRKLKIKLPQSGYNTDIEDLEALDNEENIKLIKHKNPIQIDHLIDDGNVSEISKLKGNTDKNGDRKIVIRQDKLGVEEDGDEDNPLTDIENVDELSELDDIPDTQYNHDYETGNSVLVKDEVKIENITKNNALSISPNLSDVTDVEEIIPETPNQNYENKQKIKRKKSRSIQRHRAVTPDSFDNRDHKFLKTHETTTNSLTDNEDIDLDFKPKLFHYNEKSLEEKLNEMQDNYGAVNEKSKLIKSLSFSGPSLQKQYSKTKLISSSLEINSSSDDEEFISDDELSPIPTPEPQNYSDVDLPPPTRTLILLHERDGLQPSVEILPLENQPEETLDFANNGTTDEEYFSDETNLLANNPIRRPQTPDLPIFENDLIETLEEYKNTLNIPEIKTNNNTDSEDLQTNETDKNKKFSKINIEDEHTDIENMDLSGDEKISNSTPKHLKEMNGGVTFSKTNLNVECKSSKLRAATPNLTDVEELLSSDDEQSKNTMSKKTAAKNYKGLKLNLSRQNECLTDMEDVTDLFTPNRSKTSTPLEDKNISVFMTEDKVFVSVRSDEKQVSLNIRDGSVSFGYGKEWDASKKKAESPKGPTIEEDAVEEGNTTTTTHLDETLSSRIVDKPVDKSFTDLSNDQSNALIQSESLDDKNANDKKSKKGFFDSLKTFVHKSHDHSDSESEKSPKKSKKEKKKKKKQESVKIEESPQRPPRKPKLPTPPPESIDYSDIPFVETVVNDLPPPYKPPAIPEPEPNKIEPTDEVADKANEFVREIVGDAVDIVEQKTPKPKEKTVIMAEEVVKTIEPRMVEGEEFSIVIDPTKKESPKKSKETFTLNIDETINQIEQEILEKSPILPEEKIMKPTVQFDTPVRPPRFKEHVYEDIETPRISTPPDNLISPPEYFNFDEELKKDITNFIQNEMSFSGWSDDTHNVLSHRKEKEKSVESTKSRKKHSKLFGMFSKSKESEESDDDSKKQEIIEKQDKELSKEKKDDEDGKKSSIFGLFGKKGKKQEAKPEDTIKAQLSEEVQENMKNTNEFLKTEITKYEDVKPAKVPEMKEIPVKTETVKEIVQEKESKSPKSKKSKKDDVEKETTDTFFGMFKKSKKDEEQPSDKPVLSENVLKLMNDSKNFLETELTNYEDVKPIIPNNMKTEKSEIAEKEATPSDSREGSTDRKSKEKDTETEQSDGIFGFFKKSKKPEKIETIKQESEPTTDLKEDSLEKIVSIKQETGKEQTEPIVLKQESKVEEKPKEKEDSSGFFGFFKKSKKEIALEEPIIEQDSKQITLQNMADTSNFLTTELLNYEDGKWKIKPEKVEIAEDEDKKSPIREKIIVDMIDTTNLLIKETTENVKTEIPKKITKTVTIKEDTPEVVELPQKEIVKIIDKKDELSTPETTDSSAQKPCEKINKELLKTMIKTNEFITTEIDKYHDVKPIINEDIQKSEQKSEEETKKDKDESKSGGIFGFFSRRSKSKDREIPPENLEKIDKTTLDIVKDLENKIIKESETPQTIEAPNLETDDVAKEEKSGGLFGFFAKKNKTQDEEPKDEPQPKTEIIKQIPISEQKPEKSSESELFLDKILDTKMFLDGEVEAYHDAKPSNRPERSSSEEKKSLFGLFGKKTKSQDSETLEKETETKEKKDERRKSGSPFRLFAKKQKEPTPPPAPPPPPPPPAQSAAGDNIIQHIMETKEFLNSEIENFEDVMLVVEQKTIAEIKQAEEEEKRKSGFFSFLRQLSEDKEDVQKEKIENLEEIKEPSPLSDKVKKDIQDSRDFLFIEVDNYEDCQPVIVTDIDKDHEESTSKSGIFSIFGKKDKKDEKTKSPKKKGKKEKSKERDDLALSTQIENDLKETVDDVKGAAKDLKTDITQITAETAETATKEKIEDSYEIIAKHSKTAVEKQKKELEDAAKRSSGFFSKIGEKFNKKADDSKDAIKQLKEKSVKDTKEINDNLKEKTEEIQKISESTVQTVKESAEEIKDNIQKKTKKTGGFLSKLSDKIAGKVDDIVENIDNIQDKTTNEIDEKIKEQEQKTNELENAATEKFEKVKSDVQQLEGDIEKKMVDVKQLLDVEKEIAKDSQKIKDDTKELLTDTTKYLEQIRTETAEQFRDRQRETQKSLDEQITKLEEKINDIDKIVNETPNAIKSKTQDIQDVIQDGDSIISDVIIESQTKLGQKKEKVLDNLQTAKTSIEDTTQKIEDEVSTKLGDSEKFLTSTLEEKGKNLQTKLVDTSDAVQAKKDAFIDDLAKKADQIKDVSTQNLAETITNLSDDNTRKTEENKQFGLELLEDTQTFGSNLLENAENLLGKSVSQKISENSETVDRMAKAIDDQKDKTQESQKLLSTLEEATDQQEKIILDNVKTSCLKLQSKGEDMLQIVDQKTSDLIQNTTDVVKKAEGAKLTINQSIADVKSKTDDFISNEKEKGTEIVQNIQQKVDESSTKIPEGLNQFADFVTDKSKNLAEKTDEKLKDLGHAIEKTSENLIQKTTEKTKDAKSTINETISDAKTKTHETLSAAKEKTEKVTEKLDSTKETIKESDDKIKSKTDSLLGQIQEDFDQIKTTIPDEAQEKVKDSQSSASVALDKTKESINEIGNDIKEKSENIAKDVKSGAEKVKKKSSGFFSKLNEKFSGKSSDVKDKATEESRKIKSDLEKIPSQTEHILDEITNRTDDLLQSTTEIAQINEDLQKEQIGPEDKQKDMTDRSSDSGRSSNEDSKETEKSPKKKGFFSKLGEKIGGKSKDTNKKIKKEISDVADSAEKTIDHASEKVETIAKETSEIATNLEETLSKQPEDIEEIVKQESQNKTEAAKIDDNPNKEKDSMVEQIIANARDSVDKIIKDAAVNATKPKQELKLKTDEICEEMGADYEKVKEAVLKAKEETTDTIEERERLAILQMIETGPTIDPVVKEIENTIDKTKSELVNDEKITKTAEKVKDIHEELETKTKEIETQFDLIQAHIQEETEKISDERLKDIIEDAKELKDAKLSDLTFVAKDTAQKEKLEETLNRIESFPMTSKNVKETTQEFLESQKPASDETRMKQSKSDNSDLKKDDFITQQISETNIDLSNLPKTEKESNKKPSSSFYVTSPKLARRAESQRLPSDQRPSVREVQFSQTSIDSEEEGSYIVTEPEDRSTTIENDENNKRKPLFHIESEEDNDSEPSRSLEREDSIKSNILETLTENKLESLISDLTNNLTADITEKVREAETKLEKVQKESESDTDLIEKKLQDLDRALDSLEKVETRDTMSETTGDDKKVEKKLRRVERKFERMASETLDKDLQEAKKERLTTPEVEDKREHEFQKLVSQLSTEEVSDFQREYGHLWDETTFSKSEEWDSKTPDSQVDVQELPQGEIVYMGPVTLNRDHLVNKAGIEVDVIPIMRSPCASPKPTKRSKRAQSELGFRSSKPISTDLRSLPDLKRPSLLQTIIELDPSRFLTSSTESLVSSVMSNPLMDSSPSLPKGSLTNVVYDWLHKSSPFGSTDTLDQRSMSNSYADTLDRSVSLCDENELLENSGIFSDKSEIIIPDIVVSDGELQSKKSKKRRGRRAKKESGSGLTELTTTIPQPKPRTAKTPELQLSKSNEKLEKTEKQISPVRDDLLDEEDQPETYSDKKKFWENVTKESQHKRMSLHEIAPTPPENIVAKKRTSIHEFGLAPVPKPRTLQTSQSLIESESERIISKQRTISVESSASDTSAVMQTELSQISESDGSLYEKPKIMTEYQASFKPPSERISSETPKQDKDEKLDLESSDSDSDRAAQQDSNLGYISDSGDVEHYISDSEIEDRVPQIRERQMSVFMPPTAAGRKSIYERSASLPTEDLYEVSAKAIKLRKQYYEDQIKKEMIEEQLTNEFEEEASPERKTLVLPIQEDSIDEMEQNQITSVKNLAKVFEEKVITQPPKTQTSIPEEPSPKIPDQKEIHLKFEETEIKLKETETDGSEQVISVKSLARSFEEKISIPEPKTSSILKNIQQDSLNDIQDFIEVTKETSLHKFDADTHKPFLDEAAGFSQPIETHKETEPDLKLTKYPSLSSEKSMSSERSVDDMYCSTSKPDSMEVHVDKSEIEDSEKIAELEQDATDIESKSLDSIPDNSAKYSYNDDQLPEITVTLSGKQRRISEESDENVADIKQPEEKIDSTVWEVSVQSQPEVVFDEKVVDITTKSTEKDEDFSSSVRDESDMGSEIHQDHSDSYASDKIKSESHSEIERIILDSLHQQHVDPEEAKRIASALIEEIEAEIQRREELVVEKEEIHTFSGDRKVSDYLKQLAEAKGLDDREVELVESVLARRQRELSKLTRGDTQASSMEITDEDLKYSGAEMDYSHMLEQQINQLKAEKVDDLKSVYATLEQDDTKHIKDKTSTIDKIDEEHSEETSAFKDFESFIEGKVISRKEEIQTKTMDSILGEKSLKETKDIIFEEDETISESLIEDASEIKSQLKSSAKEEIETHSPDKEEKQIKESTTDASIEQTKKSTESTKTIEKEKEIKEESSTVKAEEEKAKLSSKTEHKTSEETENTMKKTHSIQEKLSDEQQLKEKILEEFISKTEEDDGTTIEQIKKVEKLHSKTSTTIISKDHTESKIISSKLLGEVIEKDLEKLSQPKVMETEKSDKSELHSRARTSSEESKSSGKSEEQSVPKTDDVDKSDVILRKTKSDADTSSSSSNLKPDRKSGVDFEAYSSSGESHYHSFELDSNKSRPCSSDVEGLVAAGSSEYESALTSQDVSARSHITSTEYQTAASSLSSKESMKSLDSESSGNLGSVEVSEVSETLVPSASDTEADILESIDQHLIEDSKWTHPIRQSTEASDSIMGESVDVSEEDSPDKQQAADIQSKMKRSCEMTFQPEPKILVPDSPQAETQDSDEKLGTSLDEGSVLSVSLSSTSSAAALKTVIELSRADSERGGSMTVSGLSEQLSLEEPEATPRGSHESLNQQLTSEMSTSTPQLHPDTQNESVTLTSTTISDDGVQTTSTQITTEFRAIFDNTAAPAKIFDSEEPKKRGHRRQESTTFTHTMLTNMIEMERKLHSDLAESDKYTAELSFKEVSNDEKKDIDESEKEESYETEADQGFHRDIREGKYTEKKSTTKSKDIEQPIPQSDVQELSERPTSPSDECEIKDDTPEFSSETQASIGELEQEYSSAIARSQESCRKSSKETVSDVCVQKETLEKRDSHGKSSSTSSEKSSFEEAEAEAAFSMVAHISPAHKVKQICPILEDADAEKHELETRETAQKELEKRRAQMKDLSPGAIPDITVTQYPASSQEIESFDEDAPIVTQTPQTPASVSSKSSEETDQGKEYILDENSTKTPDEPQPALESKSETVKDEIDKDSGSPTNSDSFEMLEKPDIIDDFVVIEEVAKEAHECDAEGKSVAIAQKPKRRTKKSDDDEVEEYLVHSAPTPLTRMTDVKYYPDGSSSDELGFEFEDSPPQLKKGAKDYGYEYDKELEANRKWMEQQFRGDQAAMMAAGYGYEMEFERGPLEDIKEEDINDFDPTSSRIGSLGSQKESGGSLGSVKDSYSSTPEYDVLAGRKYFTRSGEHDDVSMSSLQEFENLERAMSLETKRCHPGSQDSSSNGSFKARYMASKSGQGDDVSMSSLKEFEGLEMACIAAHKIEIKVKEEEAMLTQIDEGQESIASESESCGTMSGTDKKIIPDSDEEDYEKRMFEIDEIIRQAQTNVERFIDLKEGERTESLGRGDSIEEVSKVPDLDLDVPTVPPYPKQQKDEDIMVSSVDSLDLKQEKPSPQDSSDSLEQKTAADIMTASTDSIEFQASKQGKDIIASDSIEMKEEKSGIISSDSLELAAAASAHITPMTADSIEEDVSKGVYFDHSSSSTGKDFSSSTKDELIEQCTKLDMLGSTDSLDPTSSTATHATYQYETDSVFSGSFTSGGSNTMVSSTDTIDPSHPRDAIDLEAAANRVWFEDAATGTRHFTTEYLHDHSKPYVTEVIEPSDDNSFSHTIHRRVEMPAEVRKITFHGADAEDQLRQFIEDFGEGEEVQETEEVDEAGNIHVKKIVQRRFIVKSDVEGKEHPMSREDVDTYFRDIGKGQDHMQTQLTTLTKTLPAEEVRGQGSQEAASSFKAQASRRKQLRYEISVDDQIEVDPREHDWRFYFYAEREESASDGQTASRQRPVADQHQLSDEMKQLLKELEKESKQ